MLGVAQVLFLPSIFTFMQKTLTFCVFIYSFIIILLIDFGS